MSSKIADSGSNELTLNTKLEMDNAGEGKTPVKQNREGNAVIRDWILLMRLLRMIGSFPFQEARNLPHSQHFIIHRFWSFITLYSIAASLGRFAIISYCFVFGQCGMSVLGYHSHGDNDIEDWVARCINMALPVYHLWTIICAWIVLRKSIKLVNNWEQFGQEFARIFPEAIYNSKLLQLRRVTIALATIPTVLVTALAIGQVTTVDMAGLIKFGISIFLIYSLALEDTQAILSYRTITGAFSNIRKAIKSYRKECKGRNEVINLDVLYEWERLLRLTRRQVKLTGEVQAPQQIVMLIISVIFYTQSMYILLVGVFQHGDMTMFCWVSGLMSLSQVFRLVVKVVVADQIRNKEDKVVGEIASINRSAGMDIETKLELKRLIDVVSQKPSKISLGGFVAMEIKLIPKITSYILAYLVVLIQFHMSTNYCSAIPPERHNHTLIH